MINELLHLLTDPAHLAFEVVTDLLFGGLGVLWHAAWQRRHDAQHHEGHQPERIRGGDRYKEGPSVPVTQELLDEFNGWAAEHRGW